MKHPIAVVMLAAVLFGTFGPTLRAEITADQVRQAIDRAVLYLQQQQRNDGSWPEYVGQPGGVTGLCTLALLHGGVAPDDENMQRALNYLRGKRLEKTYAVALQTMVLCKAGKKVDLPLIHRNVGWLVKNQIVNGPNRGAWSYPEGNGDPSNAQFALLALHEAERAGVTLGEPLADRTWRLSKAYWEDCQKPDGSWGYTKGAPATGSMTCAGIASLVITSDRIRQADANAVGDRVQCCGQGDAGDDGRLRRAMDWLGRNFSVVRNPGGPREGQVWMLYYLYGIERTGRLTAQRFIGGHDWYREGCDVLVRNQDSLSGFFRGAAPTEDEPLISTSLGLLFLSKGRRPILMAKLQDSPTDDWNQHRSDVANLTGFVESQWGFDMTWQVTDLRAATVEDLLQAPVLYLCGSSSPLPGPAAGRQQLAQKLRDYLDRGGFLFAEGYCGGSGFDKGFRDLMKQVFPEPEYRLQLLDAEHPIWHAEQRIDPGQLRPLWGVEFGCRTSVVYAPPDPPASPRPSLSCLWELSRGGRGEKLAAAVQAQIDAALAIGINVLAYATNRELEGREKHFRTEVADSTQDTVERGRLYVAKLRHPGGCNAAPRALVNLLEAAGSQLKIRASMRPDLLDLTDDALFDYHMVFMHGRNRFRLTDTERSRLKTFLERGGMLLADSICASPAFTESFRNEMAAIFPDRPLVAIPADDPLWTTAYGGFDLKTVTRRDPQQADAASPLKATAHKVPPELEGIKFDDRWGVVFSKYDISCALEKHDSLQCRGYARQDAARIGLNVLLYSLQQ